LEEFMSKKFNWDEVEEDDWLKAPSDAESMQIRIAFEVALQIQQYRERNNCSQKELAEKIGVSQEMISRWENAEDNLTLATIAKIGIAIGAEIRSPLLVSA
jgi:DNA-binding XRE family transcriptional regulator